MKLKELIEKLSEKAIKIVDVIDGLSENDDYDLLVWLRWLAEKKISCVDCVKTRATMSKVKPDCSRCIPISGLIQKHFHGGETNEKDQRSKN